MEQQFTHIATILFEHTYFSDGVFAPIEITVQHDGLRALKNLEILVKPFAGGVHLLTADVNLLKINQEGVRFEIRCNDSYYINYSELPSFNPSSELFYFTNEVIYPLADHTKLGLQASFVGVENILRVQSEDVILNYFNKDFSYTFNSVLDGVIHPHHVEQPDPSVNKFIFDNFPEGLVEVFEDGLFSEQFYFIPNTSWRKPIGIIKISAKNLHEHYTAQNDVVVYSIRFEARKTFWEYHFTKDRLANYNNIAIINSQREEPFDLIGTDDNSIIYRSKAAHSLSQSAQEKLQLVHNFKRETALEGTFEPIINHLPIPSPNQLYPNIDHPTDPIAPLFSHIYVYV